MNIQSVKDVDVGMALSGYARVMSKRNFGGICFWRVRFNEEDVQLVLNKLETDDFESAKKILTGSFVYFNGRKYVHNKGEHSILVLTIKQVAHCLVMLPEKFHGIKQKSRYQKRVVDLICRRESFVLFKTISMVVTEIRQFMYSRQYREFTTGILQRQFESGRSHSFSTRCNANGKNYFLSMTSELKLKRLLVAGFERVFEITQAFRNEGIDAFHSPEFGLFEAYALGSSCYDMMNQTEEMLRKAILSCFKDGICLYTANDGQQIPVSFVLPFERIAFHEAFERFVGPRESCRLESLIEKFPDTFSSDMSYFTWVNKLIEKLIVPNFVSPTFLTDIPSGLSPFEKANKENSGISDKAFLAIHGIAVADIYTDENDYELVMSRLRKHENETGCQVDEDYLDMLRFGLPQTAGIGLSLNRLFMIFLGSLPKNIKETILFPIT